MKVILQKDVKGLGKEGEMVEAKSGYARNFLFPKVLALEGTKENVEKWEEDQKLKRKEHQEALREAEKLKEKLEKISLVIKAKAGEGGRLFGAVTNQDISEKLDGMGIKVDKKKIECENIKTLGKTKVSVKLFHEVTAEVSVEIEAE